MKQLYGFWKYDLFPGVLGGLLGDPCPASEWPGAGFFKWVGSAGGNLGYVKPFLILAAKDGLALRAQLNALEAEYNAAQAKLTQDFKAKRDALIKIPKE